jgi:hypothetical protein
MGRVYVIQRQQKWSPEEGKFVDRFPTVVEAIEFGELVYLLGPRDTPYRPGEVIEKLEAGLIDFNGQKDYLLLIGNPNFLWWAGAIAARNSRSGESQCGRVRTLQWSGREQRYVVIDSVLEI